MRASGTATPTSTFQHPKNILLLLLSCTQPICLGDKRKKKKYMSLSNKGMSCFTRPIYLTNQSHLDHSAYAISFSLIIKKAEQRRTYPTWSPGA